MSSTLTHCRISKENKNSMEIPLEGEEPRYQKIKSQPSAPGPTQVRAFAVWGKNFSCKSLDLILIMRYNILWVYVLEWLSR